MLISHLLINFFIKSSSPRVTVYYAILPISKEEFPDTAPLLVALPAKPRKEAN
jgi:hypothetical protein